MKIIDIVNPVIAKCASSEYQPNTYKNKMINLPEFPLGVFPKVIADYAREFSKSCEAIPDYFACGVLAVSSVICNGSKLKVKEKYKENGNLYLCIVGRPGLSKSPLLYESMQSVFDLQNEAWADYEEELKDWKSTVRHTANKSEKEALLDSKPLYPIQYLTTKGTIEGAYDVFLSNVNRGFNPHCIYFQDELSAFFGDMDAYKSGGKGSDMETYLKLFNGTPVYITLKKERSCISNATMTVIGGIQPEVMKNAMSKGMENGMIDRMLFLVTNERPKPSNIYSNVDPDKAVRYQCYMRKLLKEKMNKELIITDDLKPNIQDVYNELFKIGGRHEKGVFKKWEICFHKLLLNLALLHEKNSLDEDVIAKARKLIIYFAKHWLAGYKLTDVSMIETIEADLKEWFISEKCLTDRDIKRRKKFQNKATHLVTTAIDNLLEDNFITLEIINKRKKAYTIVEEVAELEDEYVKMQN